MESTIYTVGGQEFELQHYGVKGMKWGRRKARTIDGGGIRGRIKDNANQFKENISLQDPISKSRRKADEMARQRSANRAAIRKATGAKKVAKILQTIGKDLINASTPIDAPDNFRQRTRGGAI